MKEQIIADYLSGLSISKLVEKYPTLNRRKITEILIDNNITIRGGRKKKTFSQEQISDIKKMIEEGAFAIDIAKKYNLNKETARLRLKELGLEIKNKNRINRHIKSDYFSKIDSAEKAYWIGFLFTDGAVDHYRKTGRVRLQLQENDLQILQKFREDLGIESKIIYDRRVNSTCCSVEFVDEQIFNDLQKYSIIPNKTYAVENLPILSIPEEFLPAFALGLFDGDGCLTCSSDFSKDVTLNYTAYHESEVIDFQAMIDGFIKKTEHNKPIFTSAWHVQWRDRFQVLKILDFLYEKSPRHLERKYNLYISLKNSLK